MCASEVCFYVHYAWLGDLCVSECEASGREHVTVYEVRVGECVPQSMVCRGESEVCVCPWECNGVCPYAGGVEGSCDHAHLVWSCCSGRPGEGSSSTPHPRVTPTQPDCSGRRRGLRAREPGGQDPTGHPAGVWRSP